MHTAFMGTDDIERGKRLAQARLAKDYGSGAAAAKILRIPVATYNQYENGTRGFKSHAPRFASFFSVQLAWLWSGEGPMKRTGKTQIQEKFDALPPEKQPEALQYLDFLASRK